MNDPDIRVGDAEREQALQALGEHMTAGRLDIEEYGERTARVATGKTRGDLMALFTDLPEPRPNFGAPVRLPETTPVRATQEGQNHPWRQRPLPQRLYAALVPLSFVVAAFLFFTVARGAWFVFLLPVAVTLFGSSLYGDDWSHDRRSYHRHQRRNRRHDS